MSHLFHLEIARVLDMLQCRLYLAGGQQSITGAKWHQYVYYKPLAKEMPIWQLDDNSCRLYVMIMSVNFNCFHGKVVQEP